MEGMFNLKWSGHIESFKNKLNHLHKEGLFCDATLVCNERFFPVHKVILSSFSEYFKEIFRKIPCKHPYIILNDTDATIMEYLLSFIYCGVVKISEEKLPTLVKTALTFKVSGLGLAVPDLLDRPTGLDADACQMMQKNDGIPLSQAKEKRISTCSGEDNRNSEVHSQYKSRSVQTNDKVQVTRPADLSRCANKGRAMNPSSVSVTRGNSDSLASQVEFDEETMRNPSRRITEVADFNGFDCTIAFKSPEMQSLGLALQNTNLSCSNIFEEQEEETDDQLPSVHHDVINKDCEVPVRNVKIDVEEYVEHSRSESLEFQNDYQSADDMGTPLFGHIADVLKGEPLDNLDETADVTDADVNITPIIEAKVREENNLTNPLELTSKRRKNVKDLNNKSDTVKPFSCYVCNFRTKHRSSLLKHLIIHTGNKPFKCNLCSYKCQRKMHLKIHSLVHTGEKPYKCKHCSKAFSQKGNLRIHTAIHSEKCQFKCKICPYETHNQASLKRHIRIHEGRVPYRCDLCDFGAQSSSDLKKHIRVHTGEKPFACDKCSYRAAIRTSLNRHMKSVHRSSHNKA